MALEFRKPERLGNLGLSRRKRKDAGMGRKPDQEQVDAVADEFDMTDAERFEFGDYLEGCKARGDRGTKNNRGDFTWLELKAKAREFLGLP